MGARSTTVNERLESLTDRERRSINTTPAAGALILIVLGGLYLNAAVSLRQALLFLVGAAAGIVLYQAAFGFTASWRAFTADGARRRHPRADADARVDVRRVLSRPGTG